MAERGLLSIGELAEATGLTVKAIRHYQDVGLLSPAATDAATGYRFYGPEQVHSARTIADLRSLGISLAEIRRAIPGGNEAIRDALVRHRRRLEARQSRTTGLLHRLDHRLKGEEVSDARQYPFTNDQDRDLGKWAFNRTWQLIEKEERTPAEDEEMLITAFASRFHWSRAGDATNFARGEWQIARVLGLLGRYEEAIRHSERSLEITEEAKLGDFDLAFAYEGMARSLALAGDAERARQFADRAAVAGAEIRDEEDRRILMGDLATLPAQAQTATS